MEPLAGGDGAAERAPIIPPGAAFSSSGSEPQGSIQYPNGDRYQGRVDKGRNEPSGAGAYEVAATADVFEGEFVQGDIHGNGTLSKANGDSFAGRFAQGSPESGTYTYASPGKHQQASSKSRAVRYRGSFKDNAPNGTGTLEFSNGDVYEGAFALGRAHGTGRYAAASGEVIAGLFENGRPVKGMRLSACGHKYLGEFHPRLGGALFHGLGRLQFSNGDSYEGSFENGHLSGDGVYRFVDGMEVRCGTWMHDAPTGLTDVILPDGSAFVGSFFGSGRQLVEGRGVLKFSDDSWFDSRNFRRLGPMPRDEDGGAFYFQKRQEAQRWVSLEPPSTSQAAPDRKQRIWLISAGKKSLGLDFSSQTSSDSSSSTSSTEHARVFLASHQHLQLTASLLSSPSGDRCAWVACGEHPGDEGRHRVAAMETGLRAVLVDEAPAAFCLVGSAGEDVPSNSDGAVMDGALAGIEEMGRKHCLVIDLTWKIDSSSKNDNQLLVMTSLSDSSGREVVETPFAEGGDVQNRIKEHVLLPAARRKPEVIVFMTSTGFCRPTLVAWITRELRSIQSRMVVVWTRGNAKDTMCSAVGCAAILETLLNI